jgi:glycosyltransferase involved in cell wall biosynthesis
MRVVIAHDFMETYGGAERVTQELASLYPDAPVYTILGRQEVADRMGVGDRFHSLLPPREQLLRHYRALAPAFPRYLDGRRLPAADILLTSSYAFAHRLRTVNHAPQVCYLHSPLRFAWSQTESYQSSWAPGRLRGAAFRRLARRMRAQDLEASRGVGVYLTQSDFVADQVHRFYDREAAIVGAPVDCNRFTPSARPPADYFLICARLVEPYKRISSVIDAFARLPHRRLVVAGDGPELGRLQARAGANVEFRGHVQDAELVDLMQHCRAAIFPSQDDFGLVPVEVMACGRPVLAYGAGGALHTVRPGVTGEHFADHTADGLARIIDAFAAERYEPARIREHAKQWERAAFRRGVDEIVRAVHEQRPRRFTTERVTTPLTRTAPVPARGGRAADAPVEAVA